MVLSPQDAELFFKLYWALLFFANQRLQVVADLDAAEDVGGLSVEVVFKLREALLAKAELRETFIQQNPAGLAEDELEIVRSWRHQVAGDFYIFRYLKNVTVFLSTDKQPVAYGVVGPTQPLEDVIGPYLPVLTKTVLLPFKNQLVYDGILSSYNVSFGPGIRRSLGEDFKTAKARWGIVATLPKPDSPAIAGPRKPGAKPRQQPVPKEATADAAQVIVGLCDQFCQDHLNDEYAAMCRKLTEKLARKRPSPVLSGKPNAWACGIVRTIGMVNFLDDPSQQPHLKLAAIDQALGVVESTGQGKSRLIRKLLKIMQLDPEWTLPSRLDNNPLVWMLSVNGFLMDIRNSPRDVQVEAFVQGLIPYIPADRD